MPDAAELVEAARAAARGSYSPHSHYRVGAAALTEDGTIVTSANVENASYPVSQCAEANAVSYAVSQGHRRIPVVAVACIDAGSLEDAYPCGRCRQIMSEFCVQTVIVSTATGDHREHSFDELLPHPFRL